MNVFEVRLATLLSDVSYKDWKFHVGQDGIGLYFIQVSCLATDATSGHFKAWKGRKWRLSTHMTDSEIVQTMLKAVLTAEEHESREKFRYKGRAIFGPHLNVDDLWDLCESAPDRRQEIQP